MPYQKIIFFSILSSLTAHVFFDKEIVTQFLSTLVSVSLWLGIILLLSYYAYIPAMGFSPRVS